MQCATLSGRCSVDLRFVTLSLYQSCDFDLFIQHQLYRYVHRKTRRMNLPISWALCFSQPGRWDDTSNLCALMAEAEELSKKEILAKGTPYSELPSTV